jgi:rod shape-determining protein MreD
MGADSRPAVRWGLLVATVYLLHIGVVIDLRVLGVHPDLMLLLAICGGLVGGAARGAQVGFFAGILADLVLRGSLGVSALTLALVGFAVGSVIGTLLRTSRAMSVGITVVASAAGVMLYAAIGQLIGQGTLSDPRWWVIVSMVSVFNALLCLPVLALGRWAEGAGVRSGLT